MRFFIEDFVPLISIAVITVAFVAGLIAFIAYTPTHAETRYGDWLCTSDKDWGFGKSVENCYKLK